jgi:hypothetical protein
LEIAEFEASTPAQFPDIASYRAWISGLFGVKSKNPATPTSELVVWYKVGVEVCGIGVLPRAVKYPSQCFCI